MVVDALSRATVATIRSADQLTENVVIAAQHACRQCKELSVRGVYKGTLIRTTDGVLKARTGDGWGTVLLVKL